MLNVRSLAVDSQGRPLPPESKRGGPILENATGVDEREAKDKDAPPTLTPVRALSPGVASVKPLTPKTTESAPRSLLTEIKTLGMYPFHFTVLVSSDWFAWFLALCVQTHVIGILNTCKPGIALKFVKRFWSLLWLGCQPLALDLSNIQPSLNVRCLPFALLHDIGAPQPLE